MSQIQRPYKVYTRRDIDSLPQLKALSETDRLAMKAVSAVLPFRVNNYVMEDLIDWSNIPNDPMYQLTFPQAEMLETEHFTQMYKLVQKGDEKAVREAARKIQHQLNPHPAGQVELNVPRLSDGTPLPGLQHKYAETVLFFPGKGQTCHAYCTYCFRWAQFVGIEELKFAEKESDSLVLYIKEHPEVTNVLITGGDPMIMKTAALRRYIEPILKLEQIESIRIGTKATAYWPYRFVNDKDSDDLLRLFDEVRAAGKHLALMSHYSHSQELLPPIAEEAVRRIQSTGAVIRAQAPLIRYVNDNADVWAEMWRKQVRMGVVPYYMFVERDTGPKHYFEVPLARAHDIFITAQKKISGLGRTVRGPSMSATPGKVAVDGVVTIHGERLFALRFLQARNPNWVGQPFYAQYDAQASWLDQLKPGLGEKRFFFEGELDSFMNKRKQIPIVASAPNVAAASPCA